MNHYENNSNGAMPDAAPLFASSWMALFYVLRKNFAERRLAESNAVNNTPTEEEK